MRSLWVRLTAGLVILMAISFLVVGLATSIGLEGFLVGKLDQQLTTSGGRFPASLEHGERPDADNGPDTRGQSEGTFGARLFNGVVTNNAVVRGRAQEDVPLSATDQSTLAGLKPGRFRTVDLSEIGDYRIRAQEGDDGDVLITGLPMEQIEVTVHRLLLVETVLFVVVLAAAAVAAAVWVRLALRPLHRVASVASQVAELPLSGGDVELPERVPGGGFGTEVGRLAEAFNRMLGHIQDSLERRQASQERLRRFAADASHELRTPVAVIRGHAELALRQRTEVPEDVRHALRRIQAESSRMGDLVDDLLLLARLDTGRPLDDDPVDLTRLLLDSADDARAVGLDHRWRLDLPEEPVEIRGDQHRLHQAIANLLTNARTHTPPGTTVTVRLAEELPDVVIEVTDDGPGVPADLQADIFDRFVRADHGRSRGAGGTGLGLAIVQAVATAHHGTATLASEPGHTTFTIRLPKPEPVLVDPLSQPTDPRRS